MILDQVLELSTGSYKIEATIDKEEALYLFSVAFSILLSTGSDEFVREILGSGGSITTLQATPEGIQ